jgi:uncharacterized protein with PIN domain
MEIQEKYNKFIKGFSKCPVCNRKMEEVTELIIKEARDSSRLFSCEPCSILIGKYT